MCCPAGESSGGGGRGGGGRGHADARQILEAEDGDCAGRVQELADLLQESSAPDMSSCQEANSGPG